MSRVVVRHEYEPLAPSSAFRFRYANDVFQDRRHHSNRREFFRLSSKIPSVTRVYRFRTQRSLAFHASSPQTQMQVQLLASTEHSIFPPEVQLFVEQSGLPGDTLQRLQVFVQRITEFLDQERIPHRISTGLFADPEYTDWVEIELTVEADRDLQSIYDILKPRIYQLMAETLPNGYSEKLLVTFERLNH